MMNQTVLPVAEIATIAATRVVLGIGAGLLFSLQRILQEGDFWGNRTRNETGNFLRLNLWERFNGAAFG